MVFERVGNRADDRGIRKHSDLDRANLEIRKARIDLRAQELQRRHMNRSDAMRVLRGERCDRRQTMHAMRRKRLEVSLDARAAA